MLLQARAGRRQAFSQLHDLWGQGSPFIEFDERMYRQNVFLPSTPEVHTRFAVMAEEGQIFFALPGSLICSSDRIYDLARDARGIPLAPRLVLAVYNVASVSAMRGDRSGAIDYLLVSVTEEEGAP